MQSIVSIACDECKRYPLVTCNDCNSSSTSLAPALCLCLVRLLACARYLICIVRLSVLDRPLEKNADERASRMTRRRNDLCAQRCQLEYKLKAISNQLEEAMRRLRDLECAASAPLRSPGSAWNINTHATFLQNLRKSFSVPTDSTIRVGIQHNHRRISYSFILWLPCRRWKTCF